MVPDQSLIPKINEHLPPEIRVIGESTWTKNMVRIVLFKCGWERGRILSVIETDFCGGFSICLNKRP